MSVLGFTVYPAAFTLVAVAAARPGALVAFSTAARTPDVEGQVTGCLLGVGEEDGCAEGVGVLLGCEDGGGTPVLGKPPAITMAPMTTAAISRPPLITPAFTAPSSARSPSWPRHLALRATTTTTPRGGGERSGPGAWPPGAGEAARSASGRRSARQAGRAGRSGAGDTEWARARADPGRLVPWGSVAATTPARTGGWPDPCPRARPRPEPSTRLGQFNDDDGVHGNNPRVRCASATRETPRMVAAMRIGTLRSSAISST